MFSQESCAQFERGTLGAGEAIPAPLLNKFTEARRASERPPRVAGAAGMALFSTTKI